MTDIERYLASTNPEDETEGSVLVQDTEMTIENSLKFREKSSLP